MLHSRMNEKISEHGNADCSEQNVTKVNFEEKQFDVIESRNKRITEEILRILRKQKFCKSE